jgi:UDP-2,4-diacetamido-2,4,6-trideoxy-beta-L-altropyranose hydrolase
MKYLAEALTFRFATEKDARLYHEWVNEPSVRKNAHRQELISWDQHEIWFRKRLNSRSIMLIFFDGDTPVGQIRADHEDSTTVIDFSVDKNYRGKNIGTIMLTTMTALARKVGKVTLLKGVVKFDNAASAIAFERSGFSLVNSMEVNGVKCHEFQFHVK